MPPGGAENGSSLRVGKWGEVEMQPSAMRAGRPCTAHSVSRGVCARSEAVTVAATENRDLEPTDCHWQWPLAQHLAAQTPELGISLAS